MRVKTFTYRPFTVSDPMVMNVNVRRSATCSILSALKDDRLYLQNARTTRYRVTTRNWWSDDTKIRTCRVHILFRDRQLFCGMPSLKGVSVNVLFCYFLRGIYIVARAISFNARVTSICPLLHDKRRQNVTNVREDGIFGEFYFCPTRCLEDIFRAINVGARGRANCPMYFSFAKCLFIYGTFRDGREGVFALSVSGISLYYYVSYVYRGGPNIICVFRGTVFRG